MPSAGHCDLDGCPNIALFYRSCVACLNAFCAAHENAAFHPCHRLSNKEFESSCDYLSFSRAINAMATAAPLVKHAASLLRPGHSNCVAFPDIHQPGLSFSLVPRAATQWHDEDWFMGGLNYHLAVTFDDGVCWLARIRQKNGNPRKLQSLVSEFVTLKALNRACPEFVPNVWMPQASPLGPPFFFMEHFKGSNSRHLFPRSGARPVESQTIVSDMATFLIQLSSLEIRGDIGSLTASSAVVDAATDLEPEPVVGPFEHWDYCISNGLTTLGPFRTSRDAWVAKIDAVVLALERGLFAINGGHLLHVYLVHLEMRALVNACEEMAVPCGPGDGEQPTFITHADSKNHLLVTDDGHLRAVIDWEGAYTAPFAEAFAAPMGFYDQRGFVRGSNELSTEEVLLADIFQSRGRKDMAQAVRGGRKYHRLAFHLGTLQPTLEMVNALYDAFLGEESASCIRFDSLFEWEAAALHKFSHVPGLESVLQLHPGCVAREERRQLAIPPGEGDVAYLRFAEVEPDANWCKVVTVKDAS